MKPASAKSCPSCGDRYDADVLFCPRDGTPLSSSRRQPSFSDRDPYLDLELDGRIRIRHLIGIGSMGRVYRAFQGGIERDVAVKILHRELSGNPDLVTRFHREAKVASRLVHPNVVQVLMTGNVPASNDRTIGGELYLVMEHLDGISLLSALAAAGTAGEGHALPLPRALHIALQICDAVGEAHAQGIVHRDLKPENIMLVRRGEDPDYVKVLDFGIARLDWADKSMATQAGLIFGTAKYISPEGAEGQPVGPQADVYSIATIIYQCLAGRAPFEGDSPVALLVQHTHAPPPELRSIARASYVPAPIAQVVMHNLAKKPGERAPDARALGRELALAMRASGLDPDDIASSLLRGPNVVKLPSKARTKALDLTPDLAAVIGGVGAPTLESAQPPDLDAILPVGAEPRAAPPSSRGSRPSFDEIAASPRASRPSFPSYDAAASPRASRPSLPSYEESGLGEVTAPPSPPRRSAPNSGAHRAPVRPDLDFDADAPQPSSPPPSTMQGIESEARPRPRRARIARLAAILACAAAASLVGVLGGRHLGTFGAAAANDSLEAHVERARDCMRRHAWDTPPGENVKEITDQALGRWPADPRVAELRREASERIVTDALGRKYAGDTAGAIRLAKLALEIHPALTTAQHLLAELEGVRGPEIAPATAAAATEPDRRPLPGPGRAPEARLSGRLPVAPSAAPGAAAPSGQAAAGKPGAPAAPTAAPTANPGAPVLPPTPPPLPAGHAPPTPSSTGPWL